MTKEIYDIAIVGAGIVGLAHALAGARRGKRVVVFDRDARANGASVRNFGFITVSGQEAGDCWEKARRSCMLWQEVARDAGIPILQCGMTVAARYREAEAVIDAFLASDMGAECRKLSRDAARDYVPALNGDVRCALYSPHEIRVESGTAIASIAAFLTARHGVTFRFAEAVRVVETGRLVTSRRVVEAEAIIVCPGDDTSTLFPDRIAAYGVTRCKLQMMRIEPASAVELKTAVMSDLGLARYRGYADLTEASALKARLDEERRDARKNGVHLIVTQSADGSLVVGDSHHYAATPDPFGSTAVDDLILAEFDRILDLPERRTTGNWIGTYASAEGRWRLTDTPEEGVRLVVVTAGCGASTSFAIGEETIADLYGANAGA
ncbi:TIGR03364 family FAD-dependent oxidoreductase [Fulvimarina sp. 2208YS6-2-32]|uniref:TIGR03364 family FAD-dependent oxidoreductase n=1 Tax=Fulvimarina uroteuthidis TaxID=3098149 RepID=A0ABU5I3F7_9HYPH|nr:TIGR03364 family FAD-dependent oxidoreductase [Fulvimarina sp. 2208YS6-2-32]MDY8109905.1 TIGR03364 family FAD-dependent oxidoreductase [Fulvimarina sp. 2208YS6-2-32]